MTITLLQSGEEEMVMTFTCYDGVIIDWQKHGDGNLNGVSLDVEQTIRGCNSERGDGSLDIIKIIHLVEIKPVKIQ